ncbi:MAG: LysE family transporter [Bacteroidia bacterium]|nr:LysE family transporter [Bacteroidia bacterium]
MQILLHLLIGAFLSFVGSAPPGLINLTIVDITLKRGIRLALLASVGAGLVEGVQSLLALRFTWLFTDDPIVGKIIQWGAVPVFLGLGIYHLLKKPGGANTGKERKSGSVFWQGVGVSALNLLAYPYWIFYGSWLHLNGWLIRETGYIIIFSLGVALGTFFLLWVYGALSTAILKRSEKITRVADRVIGVIMLGFGIWQLVRVLLKA